LIRRSSISATITAIRSPSLRALTWFMPLLSLVG
jgi:hypothetical protein